MIPVLKYSCHLLSFVKITSPRHVDPPRRGNLAGVTLQTLGSAGGLVSREHDGGICDVLKDASWWFYIGIITIHNGQ